MAKIISTVGMTGKDEQYEMLSEKVKKNVKDNQKIQNLDPNKLCMTRTIVPNRRPTTKDDINNFVNRVQGKETKKKMVEVTDKNTNNTKVEVDKVENIKKEEKKSRGRPKKNSK